MHRKLRLPAAKPNVFRSPDMTRCLNVAAATVSPSMTIHARKQWNQFDIAVHRTGWHTATPFAQKDHAMPLADLLPFFRSWIRNPLRTAAILPSGNSISALMTKEINADMGPVLELGPGTGPFTRSLLQRGIPEARLTLVEYSTEFARFLGKKFPHARILRMDAARIGDFNLFEPGTVGAVVSGLGVLTMPPRQVKGILNGAFHYLRPDGAFYQITYGPRCPVPRYILDHLQLEESFVGKTMRNIPPASVYRIKRRAVPVELDCANG